MLRYLVCSDGVWSAVHVLRCVSGGRGARLDTPASTNMGSTDGMNSSAALMTESRKMRGTVRAGSS